MTVVTLAAIVAACFLYTAYPPSVATPSISPSTGGLRFLPCVVMVAYLMHIADTSWTRRHRVLGHLIWAVCLFWAPESAFHVTFVWWPYYLWRYASGSQKGFPAALLITRQMAILMLIAVVVVALFLGAYFAFYSVLPTIDGVFAYILYPPGPIPFDFHGAFVYFVGAFGLALMSVIVLNQSHRDCPALRRAIPVVFALYAAASYYLGRSIDNNLLNIMPFIVLAFLIPIALPRQPRMKAISITAICCMIALIPSFGWADYWGPVIYRGSALDIRPGIVRRAFTFANPKTVAAIDRREGPRNPDLRSHDVRQAADEVWSKYREPVTLIAPPLLLMSSRAPPWTSMHVPANFWSIPESIRHVFLERAMQRFGKPGWVIVQPGTADPVAQAGRDLAKDFDAVYDRDISLTFGSYIAIRYLPKNSIKSAGTK
jgi:hypothetical protein